MSEIRYDFFKVDVPKFKVDAPKKDSNGFLRVDSTPTRAGVFMYRDSVGNEWGELRHPDDVFSKETMDSLKGIIYTTQENHVELIHPDNTGNKTFGMTMEDVSRVDNHARVPIKIVDGREIKKIEGKKDLELSAGYRCDVVNESGTFDGVKYQKRQKNIRYNHVARVTNARGGETCRIRLDSGQAICGVEADRIDSEDVSKKPNGESIMTMIQYELPKVVVGELRLDADEVEFPDEHKGVVGQFKKREKSLISALEEATEKLDKADEMVTEAKAKFDVMEKENKELKEANKLSIPREEIGVHVKERAKYLNYASQYKLDKADDMTNEDIIKNICLAADKVPDKEKLEDPAYARVVFDMLDHEFEKKKLDSKDNLENHSVKFSADGKVSVFDQAKKKRRA
jgi:hypothetical protein